MRQPGIEPGSTAWKAAMLTTIPLTLVEDWCKWRICSNKSFKQMAFLLSLQT